VGRKLLERLADEGRGDTARLEFAPDPVRAAPLHARRGANVREGRPAVVDGAVGRQRVDGRTDVVDRVAAVDEPGGEFSGRVVAPPEQAQGGKTRRAGRRAGVAARGPAPHVYRVKRGFSGAMPVPMPMPVVTT